MIKPQVSHFNKIITKDSITKDSKILTKFLLRFKQSILFQMTKIMPALLASKDFSFENCINVFDH